MKQILRIRVLSGALLASLGCASCGNSVTEHTPGGSGAAGATATTSSTTTGSENTKYDPPPPLACNPTDLPCPQVQYCEQGANCELVGVCMPTPTLCAPSTPTCGCDGEYYTDLCHAYHSGVDVNSGVPVSTCPSPLAEPVYTATMSFDEFQMLYVTRVDWSLNRCAKFRIEPTCDNGFDWGPTVPTGWTASAAFVSNDANCGQAPDSYTVFATEGDGFVHWLSVVQEEFEPECGCQHPCSLSIYASFEFPAEAPWVPQQLEFMASTVEIYNSQCD